MPTAPGSFFIVEKVFGNGKAVIREEGKASIKVQFLLFVVLELLNYLLLIIIVFCILVHTCIFVGKFLAAEALLTTTQFACNTPSRGKKCDCTQFFLIKLVPFLMHMHTHEYC